MSLTRGAFGLFCNALGPPPSRHPQGPELVKHAHARGRRPSLPPSNEDAELLELPLAIGLVLDPRLPP